MITIPTCYHYKGHTVYTDGRVYKAGELIAHCKTEAAAKRAATLSQRALVSARQTAHHNFIQQIVTGG